MQASINKWDAYQDFFDGLGKFTDVVTIPLKKRHPALNYYWSDEIAEPTAKWFIDRLNKKVFGRRYLGGYKQLAVIISYELGDLTHRPHFHLAIGRPKHLSKQKFHQLIQEIFGKMDWSYGSIDVRDFRGALFFRYMCKGNFEKILLGICSKG